MLNLGGLYPIDEIADILQARALIGHPARISRLLIDSRHLAFPGPESSGLFFAVKAARDGHDFISEAWENGVRNFVISDEYFPVEKFSGSNFLYVNDTLQALQQLAAFHRNHFGYPVVAITGSNGKTMVKEWLFQLLSVDKHVVRSPKSYNSQIGVPLSLWQMNSGHELAIIEAGISLPGEMQRLEQIIRPDIGILTNIGTAHDEGFDSLHTKITEKLRLFTQARLLIYQQETLQPYQGKIPGEQHFTWSYEDEHAGLYIKKVRKVKNGCAITVKYTRQEGEFRIPFEDKVSLHNAITCCCLLLHLGYSMQEISRRMQQLAPVSMRLELKQAINRCSVINDSYNADLISLEMALDFLARQHQHRQKTVILSDMLQSGLSEEILYQKIADLLRSKKIDRLIGIGEAISRMAACFSLPEQAFYKSTEAFTGAFDPGGFTNEAILLKGARPFGFERIGRLLEHKLHDTVLEINLNALIHNLNFYRSKLAPGTRIMAMVKAFSYGSGGHEIASLLQYHKVDYLAVAYADEGIELRKAGITLPIMVMSPEVSSFGGIYEYKLEPELYHFRILREWDDFLSGKGAKAWPVHLKLDTGMHRLGFEEKDLEALCRFLKENRRMNLRSVFSHLAASEDAGENDFTELQIRRYARMNSRIKACLQKDFIRHILNSAGALRYSSAQFDMVRLGLGMYGIDQSGDAPELIPVGTLKTSITQIREVPAGDTVGYGRAGRAEKPSKIATVKLGYADGFDRRLGNGRGAMLVNGQKAPVTGHVCMDMTMLDVTGIDCRETDEVVVFGPGLPVQEIAALSGTNAYEVLSRIPSRVKRVYTYE